MKRITNLRKARLDKVTGRGRYLTISGLDPIVRVIPRLISLRHICLIMRNTIERQQKARINIKISNTQIGYLVILLYTLFVAMLVIK